MSNPQIQGNWNELKGKIKSKWAKLTDDDLKGAEGNFDQLHGKIQKLYGHSKEKATQEIEEFKKQHFNKSPSSSNQNANLKQ